MSLSIPPFPRPAEPEYIGRGPITPLDHLFGKDHNEQYLLDLCATVYNQK